MAKIVMVNLTGVLTESEVITVEPRYNEVFGITRVFFAPVIVKYMKNDQDITKLRYSEHILPVFWPFVKSRFYCTGKSQTEALMYCPSDSEINTSRSRFEISL